MPQFLFFCSRLPSVHRHCAIAVACLCGTSALAQSPLCTLTFADPVSPTVLSDATRACLDRAAVQLHSHPGTQLVLTGAVAARIAAARQYLINTRAMSSASVTSSTRPGDPHMVQVALAAVDGAAAGVVISGELSHLIHGDPSAPQGGSRVQPPPHAIIPPQPTPPQPAAAGARPSPAEHKDTARAEAGHESGPPPPATGAIPPQSHASSAVPEKASTVAQPSSEGQPARPAPPAQQPAAADPNQAPHEAASPGVPKDAPAAYPAGEQVQNWERRLKSGAIDFNSPQTMVVGKPTGVVVTIHGYADTSHTTLPGVQRQGTLKVSDYMRVDLDAPLQPGEFLITPAQGAKLPIPIDGSNSWTFQVTPLNRTADPQTLVIHPYLYPPARLDAQPLQERDFTVQVTVEPFWSHIVDLWKDDPVKVAKYLLPGGEGFKGVGAFLTGLIGLLTALGVVAWVRRKILKTGDDPPAK